MSNLIDGGLFITHHKDTQKACMVKKYYRIYFVRFDKPEDFFYRRSLAYFKRNGFESLNLTLQVKICTGEIQLPKSVKCAVVIGSESQSNFPLLVPKKIMYVYREGNIQSHFSRPLFELYSVPEENELDLQPYYVVAKLERSEAYNA